MASVTGPGSGGSPRVGRRRWLAGVVVAWIVAVAGLAVWSVSHDQATVAEQRGIGVAVAELQRAAGVVLAAAGADGRVVVLGDLRVIGGCRITPVRHGQSATRDVDVYVRDGEVRATVAAVAAGLPAGYRADLATSRAATRLSLHADAGDFVGIDADANATAKVVTLQLSTGCRPSAAGEPNRADPPAGPVPPALTAALNALTAPPQTPSVQSVACPDGGVAATYTVDGLPMPADLRPRLRVATTGATVLRSDDAMWAYHTGTDSIVILFSGKQSRVNVTTAC
jgi:hypothetical protein